MDAVANRVSRPYRDNFCPGLGSTLSDHRSAQSTSAYLIENNTGFIAVAISCIRECYPALNRISLRDGLMFLLGSANPSLTFTPPSGAFPGTKWACHHCFCGHIFEYLSFYRQLAKSFTFWVCCRTTCGNQDHPNAPKPCTILKTPRPNDHNHI